MTASSIPLLSSLQYDAVYCKKPEVTTVAGRPRLLLQHSSLRHAVLLCSTAAAVAARSPSSGTRLAASSASWRPIVDEAVLTSQRLLVAVCHLKAKPDFSAVRLRQTAAVLHRVEADGGAAAVSGRRAVNVNVLLCGDMNDVPCIADARAGDDLGPAGACVAAVLAAQPVRSLLQRLTVYWTTCKRREAATCSAPSTSFSSRLLGLCLLSCSAFPLPCEMPSEQYPSDHLALMGKIQAWSARGCITRPLPPSLDINCKSG